MLCLRSDDGQLAENQVTLRQADEEITLSNPDQVVLELKVEEEE